MVKAPTVTIHPDGQVVVEGDCFRNCSCGEAWQLGASWALKKLGAAMVEHMTVEAPKLSARG